MRHLLYVLICNCSSAFLYAQGMAVELGYQYQNTSYFQTGVSYRFSDNYTKNPFSMNAALATNFSTENRITLGVQQRFLQTFEGSIAFSNKDLQPSLGINVLNAIKLHIGYCFPYQNKLNSSVTFGLVFALGPKNYYDHLVIGF